jgi:hypothetical protein
MMSISTLLIPSPISTHLKILREYWVNEGCNKKNTVMVVTQQYLLNFSELLKNISLKATALTTIKTIGIRAIQKTLKYAMLSKISLAEVSISNQS